MVDYLFSWPVVGAAIAILMGGFWRTFMAVTPAETLLARICSTIAALLLLAKFGTWVATVQSPLWQRILTVAFVFGLIGVGWVECWRYLDNQYESINQAKQATQPETTQVQNNKLTVPSESDKRYLAPDQKKAILAFLANEPKGAFVIKASMTAPDAWSYADQLAEPFRHSGWNVRIDNAMFGGPNVSGVRITIKNPEAVPPSSIVLKNALEAAGITTPAFYDPGVPDAEEVWLSVGSR